MNKKVLLTIITIISMVLCINKVDAATELTCVYKAGTILVGQKATKIVQYADGTKKAFINSKRREPKADDDAWFHAENASFKSDEELQSCPNFIDYSGRAVITFREEEKNGFTERIQEIKGVEDKHQITKDENYVSNEKSNWDDEISSNKWLKGCKYKRLNVDNDYVYLYFNKENLRMVDGDTVLPVYTGNKMTSQYQKYCDIDVNKLIKEYGTNKCPTNIYVNTINTTRDTTTIIYSLSRQSSNMITYIYTGGSHEDNSNDKSDVDNCGKLFGPDLVNIINDVMKWIRIAVPILLIGFGILDFTKATFSKSEDDMKKIREKFFKRIAAAVLVFLAPYFINLILRLANSVWGWISPETCIK